MSSSSSRRVSFSLSSPSASPPSIPPAHPSPSLDHSIQRQGNHRSSPPSPLSHPSYRSRPKRIDINKINNIKLNNTDPHSIRIVIGDNQSSLAHASFIKLIEPLFKIRHHVNQKELFKVLQKVFNDLFSLKNNQNKEKRLIIESIPSLIRVHGCTKENINKIINNLSSIIVDDDKMDEDSKSSAINNSSSASSSSAPSASSPLIPFINKSLKERSPYDYYIIDLSYKDIELKIKLKQSFVMHPNHPPFMHQLIVILYHHPLLNFAFVYRFLIRLMN